MEAIPAWLGGVGALIVIAAALGAAVAVYRTNLQATALKGARDTIADLRGEIGDYERREAKLEADVRVLETQDAAKAERITVLEDLLTKRSDDAEIRAAIAEVRDRIKAEQEAVTGLRERLDKVLRIVSDGAK